MIAVVMKTCTFSWSLIHCTQSSVIVQPPFFDVPIRWVKSRFFQIEHKNMISIWKMWYSWALRGHNSLFWRKIITIQLNIGLRVKSQRVTMKGMTVVRVLCTKNSDDCSLQRIVKKSKFNKLGEFHKEWTVSVDQEPPHTDGLQERGYWNANKKPCLNRRSIWHELRKARSVSVAQRSKVSSDESKISILWENQGPTVLRRKKVFKLQCEVSAKVPGLLLIITAFDWPTKLPDPQPHRESVVYYRKMNPKIHTNWRSLSK